MPKCELTQLTPASLRIFRSSAALYFAKPAKPESAYPTGEHNSMVWNPASASFLIVPGKSLAIISRTGHVWHPIGIPSGLACSSKPPAEIKPAAAAWVAALLTNSLLDISDIGNLLMAVLCEVY